MKNEEKKIGNDCVYLCLEQYFQEINSAFPLYSAFIIGGGLDIEVGGVENSFIGCKKKLCDIYIDGLNKLGIKVIKKVFPVSENVNVLKKELQQGKYVILQLASKEIEYHSIFAENRNVGHFVNITRIRGSEIFIRDNYIPTREISTFEGWYSIEKCNTAWQKCGCICFILEKQNLPEFNNIICEYNKKYFGSVIKQYCEKLEDIKKFFLLEIQGEINKKIYNLIYDIKLFGFLFSKKYLHAYMTKFDIMDFFWLDEYSKVVKEWNGLILLILKLEFFINEEKIASLNNKIEKIIQYEILVLQHRRI